MRRRLTEVEIAAHVDGMLDAATDADVRARLAADPSARALAGQLRELNAHLAAAYPLSGADDIPPAIANLLATPVPKSPAGAVGDERSAATDRVVASRNGARGPAWLAMAAAASITLVVGFASGAFFAGLGDGEDPALDPAATAFATAGTTLAVALETLPSGTLSADAVRPVVTFRDAAGRPCREFETGPWVAPRAGIACRTPSGVWEVLAIVPLGASSAPVDGAFHPASGANAEGSIDTALDAIGASDPVAPGEEARLLSSGWR